MRPEARTDIDRDGNLDVVFGGDWQSTEVLRWWENPSPKFEKSESWKRHMIKRGGKAQHHDQVFGDFLGAGTPQLAFWNEQAKTLFLAEIPEDPRSADSVAAPHRGGFRRDGRLYSLHGEGMRST